MTEKGVRGRWKGLARKHLAEREILREEIGEPNQDSPFAAGVPEYMRVQGQPDCVTFEALGFRDVLWCCYTNEPVIISYRDGSSGERVAFCEACRQENPEAGSHHFICNVGKTLR